LAQSPIPNPQSPTIIFYRGYKKLLKNTFIYFYLFYLFLQSLFNKI
jgi:hypothetical protein